MQSFWLRGPQTKLDYLEATIAAGEFARVKTAERFSIAAVASRKVLCVNDRVQALKAAWRINDQCLELQSKSDSKKQMLSGALHRNLSPSLLTALRHHTLRGSVKAA